MLEKIFGDKNKEQESLKREFLDLRNRESIELEYVPYPPRVGIVWRVSGLPLITGFDTPVIDCAVMVVFGKDKAGMMHVSPNTLPDDFSITSGERYPVVNTDVDKQYLGVLHDLGSSPERIVIVGGDSSLVSELVKLVSGQEVVWGVIAASPRVKVERVDLGTFGKEIIADPKQKSVYTAEYKLKKFADGRTVVKT